MSTIYAEIYATIDESYEWWLSEGEYLDELDELDAMLEEYELAA